MKRLKLLVIAAVIGLLSLGSAAAVVRAFAQTTPSSPPAATQQEIKGTNIDKEDVEEANEKPEMEEAEKKEGDKEEADENLPGGGHADPDGANVDHQFEGIE